MIFIIAFVAIAIGFYFMQRNKIKQKERRERMLEKQQELIERLRSMKRGK